MKQSPEQIACDKINTILIASGWIVQAKSVINLAASSGVAVREYQICRGEQVLQEDPHYSDEDPKIVLNQFCSEYYSRIITYSLNVAKNAQ